jgi:hypothetical protein
MNAFVILSGIVFAVVAVVHAARLFYGWPVRIGSAAIPVWVSWLGIVGAGVLAVWAWHLAAL